MRKKKSIGCGSCVYLNRVRRERRNALPKIMYYVLNHYYAIIIIIFDIFPVSACPLVAGLGAAHRVDELPSIIRMIEKPLNSNGPPYVYLRTCTSVRRIIVPTYPYLNCVRQTLRVLKRDNVYTKVNPTNDSDNDCTFCRLTNDVHFIRFRCWYNRRTIL